MSESPTGSDVPSDPQVDDAAPKNRACAAGEDCGGKYAIEEPIFNLKDYIWMLIGVSSRPVPIETKCALCKHVWEVSEPRRPW